MKIHNMVKDSENHTVVRAFNAVRDLLRDVPAAEVESVVHEPIVGSIHRFDGLIHVSSPGGRYAIIVEVKRNGAPRFVRSGVYQLQSYVARLRSSAQANGGQRFIPMLVSPYLSPQSRAICTDHGVAYLDLVGNARLAFGTVYIERAVADQPKSEARALRSIFSPRAAAILRVLLRDPDRAWRVAELAKRANASLGHVSNVRKALLDREWLEVRGDGAVLTQPDALLKSWRRSYRHPAGRSITGYTHLHGGQLDERLRGKLNPNPEYPRAIYSLNSASQWLAPFGRSGTHSFYADNHGAELLKERLMLTPAARGANVVVRIPTDESLFDDASEPDRNVFCTSPIVTYLDLWVGNERQREAAEHLADKFLPWLN